MKIYTASKLNHAKRWVNLSKSEAWKRHEFTAQWIFMDENLAEDPYAKEKARDIERGASERHWIMDHMDVARSDALLIYCEKGETQRGSLIEAGMAIALKIPVVAVGSVWDLGSWVYHPGVTLMRNLDDALLCLNVMEGTNYGRKSA